MNKQNYLQELREKIVDWFGLYFPDTRLGDLERGLIQAARELKMDESVDGIYQWMMRAEKSRNDIHVLATHLTVGETYFFREQIGLDLFKELILPRHMKNEKTTVPFRIWCAGCSSGEEPYTLAIIIKEYFPQISEADISILASDISPLALKKAIQGIYSEWSFRTIDPFLKSKYFRKEGGNWRISPEIQRMVNFSFINLADQSYPSPLTQTEHLDLILCRNVLMYFDPAVIKEISKKFLNCLNDDGWLITSQVELNDEYYSDFHRIQFLNGIFYQKSSTKINKAITHPGPVAGINHPVIPFVQPDKKSHKNNKNVTVNPSKNQTLDKKTRTVTHQTTPDLRALFDTGCYRQITEFMERSGNHPELTPEKIPIIARAYANTGHYREAAHYLEKLIYGKQTTPEVYYLYATVLFELNDYEKAETHLKKAIYLDHRHIPTYLLLGNLMNIQGKKELASKYFKNVFTLLDQYQDQDLVYGTEGMTAGRIKSMIVNMIE